MYLVDHIFVLLLLVVQPVYGLIESRRYEAQAKAGQPIDRVRFYRHTALLEWTFLAVLGAAWFKLGRPIADLGFTPPGGVGFWSGTALLVIMIGFLTYSWRAAKRASESHKADQAKSIGKVVQFLPQTSRELNNFIGVSITAGIVEEIVYRGFMIWYFAQFMPLWIAVVVSSVVFGLGHSYQGVNGASRCGLVGLAFGIYYVGTGSIWLPIVAHALLDVLQGVTAHEILRKDSDTLKPQLA